MQSRRPICELYSTTRIATLSRLLRSLLGSVAVVLMSTGQALADDQWTELGEHHLHRIRQATADLQEPLTPSERFRWLAPFAHIWGGGQPHRRAIHALSRAELPAASFALAEVAGDSEFPFRREALYALGVSPHRVALPVLLRALEEADPKIQIPAISSLILLARSGMIAPYFEEIVARLAHLVDVDPDRRVRRVAAAALPSFGRRPGVARFFALPPNPSASVSEACQRIRLRAYFQMNVSRAQRSKLERRLVAEVRRPTSSHLARLVALGERLPSDGEVPCTDPRSEALRWLGRIRASRSENLVIEVATKDPDPAMRAAAVTALGFLGGRSAEAVIIAALDDPNLEVRSVAVSAFDHFSDARKQELVTHFTKRLVKDDSAVLRERITAASESLPGDWTGLVPALADPSVIIRRAAEASLLERGRAEDMALLFRALEEDARLAIRAARILAAWPTEEVTEALIDIVEFGPSAARPRAALALGLRGDESAREPLERVANSGPQGVAIASLQALQDLDRPSSLDALQTIAMNTKDPHIRDAAENAYNMIARSVLTMKTERTGDSSRTGGSR